MQKKCSMIYWILLPKAEDGCIKPYQCQSNSTCLKLTYYIETLVSPTIGIIGKTGSLVYFWWSFFSFFVFFSLELFCFLFCTLQIRVLCIPQLLRDRIKARGASELKSISINGCWAHVLKNIFQEFKYIFSIKLAKSKP